MDEHPTSQRAAWTPRREHETTDANVLGIAAVGVALALVIALGFVVAWWIFCAILAPNRDLSTGPFPPDPRLEGLLEPGAAHVYAPPTATPAVGYGWVDQPGGIVRIPVDRALELFLRSQNSRQKGEP
ncbi:MAG TPA: hypothetical protein VFE24_06940 [Pirellulales bacterium]|jgi:hypothetical protein|nr:hypothetical protein [Pirellulales bacterium]